MRRVLYYVKQPVHTVPPCLAEVCMLRDRGIEVVLLTQKTTRETEDILREKGVVFRTYRSLGKGPVLVRLVYNFLQYVRLFHWLLSYRTDDCVLWLGSEPSAMRGWFRLKRIRPMIVSCLEFYEKERYQKVMPRITRKADVVTACEPNRARLMREWWKLEKTPYVLRNKTYRHPRARQMEGSTPQMREVLAVVEGRRFLLYQGAVNDERDLTVVAEALRASGLDYDLVVCGREDRRKGVALELKDIYPRTLFFGNLPSPQYLELTSRARIGIACYADTNLNQHYCAPNKIYEYAGFGIPMICNGVPGLTETVVSAGAAEAADFGDPDSVAAAVRRIDADYASYSEAAARFFEETDVEGALDEVLEDAFSRTRAGRRNRG